MRILLAIVIILTVTSTAPAQTMSIDDFCTKLQQWLWPKRKAPTVPVPRAKVEQPPPVVVPLVEPPRVEQPQQPQPSPPPIIIVVPPPDPPKVEPKVEAAPKVDHPKVEETHVAVPRPKPKPKPGTGPGQYLKPKSRVAAPADDSGPDLRWPCWLVVLNAKGKTDAELEAMRIANGVPPLTPKQIRQAKACLAGVAR